MPNDPSPMRRPWSLTVTSRCFRSLTELCARVLFSLASLMATALLAPAPPAQQWRPTVASNANVSVGFDVLAAYRKFALEDNLAAPLAAILALTEALSRSEIGTMAELLAALDMGAATLETHRPHAIGISAGCNLFIKFVAQYDQSRKGFEHQKTELVCAGQKYVEEARSYRDKIAHLASGFVQDDCVILTHSYSRVVMQTLLHVHKQRRITVYITEARPRGLGQKTCDELAAAGIPCTVILDSAVAYIMDKIDICMVGSEAVVESGGLVNAVGSYQMAVVAKIANKPFYALAESYKFHRLFPLSQFDLPSAPLMPSQSSPTGVAQFAGADTAQSPMTPTSPRRSHAHVPATQSRHAVLAPSVDYTKPELITLVFSDVGILTPDGVSQYLVSMFSE